MSSAYGEKPASCRQLPYGLMSLWQMINCSVLVLCALGAETMLDELTCEFDFVGPPEDHEEPLSDFSHRRAEGWIGIAEGVAKEFEWQAVLDRIELIRARLDGKKGRYTKRLHATEMRVLRETINSSLKNQYIYRYPNDKAVVLGAWKNEWAATIKSFPSATSDIWAGVDLWALQHHTASAFHFMRVLEHGLRALASDVGKSFDVQNWQNIIEEIETEIRVLGKSLPRGSDKIERLRFLSEAAKEFVYFKDGWRNYVAHNRANYDQYQARSILEHVKVFMTTLSSKLSENPSGGPLS